MKHYETHQKHWNLATALLKENGINPINERMTFAGGGGPARIIIHSKALANCIIIGHKMTDDEITDYIKREIEISKVKGA